MFEDTGKLRNMTSIYLLCDGQILLLYRQGNSIVSNLWIGSAGGHFEQEELNSASACVLRELKEEINIDPEELLDLNLRYITLRRANNEIRQNYYFFAKIHTDVRTAPISTEGICQWFPLTEVSDLPMPYTAKYVLDHFISHGQFTNDLYGGIANNSGVSFVSL